MITVYYKAKFARLTSILSTFNIIKKEANEITCTTHVYYKDFEREERDSSFTVFEQLRSLAPGCN